MKHPIREYVSQAMQSEWRFDELSGRWSFREELDATPERKVWSSSPEVRQFLGILATSIGATRILEVGTSVGHGTLWLSSVLPPGGSIVTIENNAERHAEAQRNFRANGVNDTVHSILGDALDILENITGPFDLVFIDGDKPQYYQYFEAIVRLCHRGSVVVADDINWANEELGERFRTYAAAHEGVTRSLGLDIGAGLEVMFMK